MNQEKIIEKLLKKAEIIKEVELKPEEVTELDLEAFYDTYKAQKGELYYNDNKIYLKQSQGYYMVKLGIGLKEIEKKVLNIEEKIKDIEGSIRNIVNWAKDINKYISYEFDKLNKEIKKKKK